MKTNREIPNWTLVPAVASTLLFLGGCGDRVAGICSGPECDAPFEATSPNGEDDASTPRKDAHVLVPPDVPDSRDGNLQADAGLDASLRDAPPSLEAGDAEAGPGPADSGDGGPLEGGSTCDPTWSPKQSGCVLQEPLGVFVSLSGDDVAGYGTPASPVKTLPVAMAKAKARGLHRVYICAGTYPTHLEVAADTTGGELTLYGGLSCEAGKSWEYTGADTRFVGIDGPALRITGAPHPLTLEDLTFASSDGREDGGTGESRSSIAAYVSGAASLTLRRTTLRAGNGWNGVSATAPLANACSGTLAGTSGSYDTEGKGGACTCSRFGSSTGGDGGRAYGSQPVAGTWDPAGAVVGADTGEAGKNGNVVGSQVRPCGSGAAGTAGAPGAAGTRGEFGTLSGMKWLSQAGLPGGFGYPGLGGGGGGAQTTLTASAFASGPGGGSGGCGGSPGLGGAGGGASIALVVLDTVIVLDQARLESGRGGDGGAASSGDPGGPGGAPGTVYTYPGTSVTSCTAGRGGAGGGGGGGGGGAGGSSIGLLWRGKPPTIDGASVTSAASLASVWTGAPAGRGGAPGQGGGAATGGGAGNVGAAGADGLARAVLGL